MATGDLIGAIIDGRYKVVEHVASGAMGAVYRGERLKLGRAVAIKFLHARLADEGTVRQRFEIEARAMAQLEHPHCAAVIDVGTHEGAPYVVMDYIRGTDLRALLDEGRLEPARAVAIMLQILSGLAHAHELGIVHRDIKPANVMLSVKAGLGEQVRILDFGLARLREQTSALTVGMVVGTPAYMAPEQCQNGTIDARTDLYACGVLLFEMLTGVKPFAADDPVEVLKKQLHERPPRIADVAPDVAAGGLEDVIARAMAKRPEDRYASASEMSVAIAAAQRGERVAAPPVEEVLVALPDHPVKPPRAPLRLPQVSTRTLIAVGAIAGIVIVGVIARCAGGGGDAPAARAPEASASDTGPADHRYADVAEISFAIGRTALFQHRIPPALAAYRDAIHGAPQMRSDPTLIASVVAALPDQTAADFLVDVIGPAAAPYLDDASTSNEDPAVRAAAHVALQRLRR